VAPAVKVDLVPLGVVVRALVVARVLPVAVARVLLVAVARVLLVVVVAAVRARVAVVVVPRPNVAVNMDIAVLLAIIVGQVVKVDLVPLGVVRALVVRALVVRALVVRAVVVPVGNLVVMQHIMLLDWEAVVGRTRPLTISLH